MSEVAKFLRQLFGTDHQGGYAINPSDLLVALDSGVITLAPELMQSMVGSEALTALVNTVCRRGAAHIVEMDKACGSAQMPAYLALVDRLMGLGADPWMLNEKGETPFGQAISGGWEQAALVFLKHPSTPKGTALGEGTTKNSPWLVHAATHDMRPVLKALLAAGGDPSVASAEGVTALHQARSGVVVDMLLRAGADADAHTKAGSAPENFWATLSKGEDLTASEQQKMLGFLMLRRAGDTDPTSAAINLVADAGHDMGYRDGLAVLRKAGVKNPHLATNRDGLTIFASRLEGRLNALFCNYPRELVSNSEYVSRLAKIMPWMERDNPPGCDRGLARLAMWMFRARRDMGNSVEAEAADGEKKMGLPTDLNPADQQAALDALVDAGRRGTIKNASAIAAITLAGMIKQTQDHDPLFASVDGRTPLLFQWVELAYKGMEDPAWMPAKGTYGFTRVDAPLREALRMLGPQMGFPDGNFWDQPQAAHTFLRLYASAIAHSDFYANPPDPESLKPYWTGTAPDLGEWIAPWFNHIPFKRFSEEIASNAVSNMLYQRLREVHPHGAAYMERHDMLGQTPQATHTQKPRRTL